MADSHLSKEGLCFCCIFCSLEKGRLEWYSKVGYKLLFFKFIIEYKTNESVTLKTNTLCLLVLSDCDFSSPLFDITANTETLDLEVLPNAH